MAQNETYLTSDLEEIRKEEEKIRSWLVFYPDQAFIVPDGSRLYVMRRGQMLRLNGKGFNEMSGPEINYILDNIRPISKEV